MTNVQNDLAALFRRDIGRLREEVLAFGDSAALWKTAPGVTNSAGNLALHLEGNLREFIGRQLGGIAYERDRPLEFAARGLAAAELANRITALEDLIPGLIAALDQTALEAMFPHAPAGSEPMNTLRFLIHLHGHLTYHLGQINYLRRMLMA